MKRMMLLGCVGLLAAVSSGVAAETCRAASAAADEPGVYELRIYTTAKGRLPALHKRFREHTVALFKKHGMTNVVYWTPLDKPDTLVYLLWHKSVAARNKSFAAFRKDPEWQRVFKESRKEGPIVLKVQSTLLKVTDYSPRHFAAAPPGWIYELRTYTTHPGRLPALHRRFRDHTMALFKKHGIHNVLYTTPVDEKRGRVTLVYLIAHKDHPTAMKSWKAFAADPAWKAARKASVQDGPILIKGGVKRLFLKTTDYSPVR